MVLTDATIVHTLYNVCMVCTMYGQCTSLPVHCTYGHKHNISTMHDLNFALIWSTIKEKEREKERERNKEREREMREDDTLAYNIHSDDHGITSRAISAIIIAKIALDVHTLYNFQCMVHMYSVPAVYIYIDQTLYSVQCMVHMYSVQCTPISGQLSKQNLLTRYVLSLR